MESEEEEDLENPRIRLPSRIGNPEKKMVKGAVCVFFSRLFSIFSSIYSSICSSILFFGVFAFVACRGFLN